MPLCTPEAKAPKSHGQAGLLPLVIGQRETQDLLQATYWVPGGKQVQGLMQGGPGAAEGPIIQVPDVEAEPIHLLQLFEDGLEQECEK